MVIEIKSKILNLFYTEHTHTERLSAYFNIRINNFHECFDIIDIYSYIKRFNVVLLYENEYGDDINLLNLKYYI